MASTMSYMAILNRILDDETISQKNCVEQLKALRSTIENDTIFQPHDQDTAESILQKSFEKDAILASDTLAQIAACLKVLDTGNEI